MARRRTLDETKQLLLDAGIRMLAGTSDTLPLPDLSMIDVCREAGLKTAGSGYKIWPTQDDYRQDLLVHAIRGRSGPEQTMAIVTKLVDKFDPTPSGLRELMRVAAADHAEVFFADAPASHYAVYLTVWLASDRGDEELAELVRESDTERLARWAEVFEWLLDTFGLEWVPPFDADSLTLMLSAAVEGLSIRRRVHPERVDVELKRPVGDEGEEETWTLFGSMVDAIVRMCTRPRRAAA